MSNENNQKELTPEQKLKLELWFQEKLAICYAKERKDLQEYKQRHANHKPL